MADKQPGAALAAGDTIAGVTKVVSEERIRWYGDALGTASTGELKRAYVDIHTDVDYARGQGLPEPIADGMLSTNWVMSMLVVHFGHHALVNSSLRTKYIKPVFPNMIISVKGRVRDVRPAEDGLRHYDLEVWCEDQDGVKRTDGDATIVAP